MSYPRLSQQSYQSPTQVDHDILVNVIPRLLHLYQNFTNGYHVVLVNILNKVVTTSMSKPYQGCHDISVNVFPQKFQSLT